MTWRAATLLLSAALLLGGCGDSRVAVPSVAAMPQPGPLRTLSFPRAGVRLSVPGNWSVGRTGGPLVATVASGSATITLWRYPAAAVPPTGLPALAAARESLLGAARARDPRLLVLGTSLVSVDGAGAVILRTVQRFGGYVRRVTSMHVYVPGGEVVLEEYAPLGTFGSVDRTVFSRVQHSLRLIPTRAT